MQTVLLLVLIDLKLSLTSLSLPLDTSLGLTSSVSGSQLLLLLPQKDQDFPTSLTALMPKPRAPLRAEEGFNTVSKPGPHCEQRRFYT